MPDDLQHAVVLIVGGGSGIGLGCAMGFAQAGAKAVMVADLNLDNARAAAESSKSLAVNSAFSSAACVVDVSDEASVDAMVETTVARFGRIDASVHCAGVSYADCRYVTSSSKLTAGSTKIGVEASAPVAEASTAEFDRFSNVNVRGTFLCTKAVSRAMQDQPRREVTSSLGYGSRDVGKGSIVNLGSANSVVGTPRLVQYVAAKHAVVGITRSAGKAPLAAVTKTWADLTRVSEAADNAEHGIRVNVVCPSWVDTPMVSRAIAGMPQLQEAIKNLVPMKRIATIDEVVGLVTFLTSSSASYITGATLLVDGGTTAVVGN